MAAADVAAFQQVDNDLRRRVTEYALLAWEGLGEWRDSDVDRFVEHVTPVVHGGRARVAELTGAYLGSAGRIIDTSALRGVPDDLVYRRPAVQLYTELSHGALFSAALEVATNRLKSIVATDLQMAHVRQAQESLSPSNAAGYRRHLNGEVDCAKCILASTSWYRRADLMPIHPGCDCTVERIESRSDLALSSQIVDDLHAKVEGLIGTSDRGGRDVDYRKLLVSREHGEIGPLLAWDGERFTGPADLPRSPRAEPSPKFADKEKL